MKLKGRDIPQNLTYRKKLNIEIIFLQIEYFYKYQNIFQTNFFFNLVLTAQKVLKFTIKNSLVWYFLKFFDLKFCISKGSRWVKRPVYGSLFYQTSKLIEVIFWVSTKLKRAIRGEVSKSFGWMKHKLNL